MAMSLLVGEPFMGAMALVFALAVVLAASEGIRPTVGTTATIAKSAAAWVIAVAVAAVSWLPPLRMLESTERAQPFTREAAEGFSHHPLRLLEMLMPGALGDPTGEYPAGRWVGETGAAGAPLFSSSYLGVVAVAFALLGLCRRRLQLTLAGFALLALLVAFGKHLPVHQVWRQVLFPFARMHSPEKYVTLVVAPFSLLAGLGASRVLATVDASLRRLLYLGLALLGFLATAGWLLPDALVAEARSAGLRGLILLGLLLALMVLRRRFAGHAKLASAASLAILALVAFDLGRPANRVTGFGSGRLLTRPPEAAVVVLNDSLGVFAPPRLFRLPGVDQVAGALGPDATWQDSQKLALDSLTPNTLNVFGLGVSPGYASAIPSLIAELDPKTYADLDRTLRLLSAPYAFLPDAGTAALVQTGSAAILSRPLPHASLLRLAGVLPRVYLPGQVRSLPNDEAVRRLRDDAVVRGREALVLTAGRSLLTPKIADGEARACALESFAFSRLVARCTTEAPNLAVFVEQYDPGWSATVDGTPAPLLRANLVMRAVPIPAGTHRIELAYHAPGLPLALFVSCSGLLLFLGLAAVTRVKPASKHGPG